MISCVCSVKPRATTKKLNAQNTSYKSKSILKNVEIAHKKAEKCLRRWEC
jgi:hypothetical protein